MASDLDRFLVRLRRLEGQLERIANDFFFTSSFTDCPQGTLWQPPTDVFETETGVVVRMEVPGLDPRDIVLVLSGNTLRIRATRQDTHQHTKTRCHQFEVRFGRFERVRGPEAGRTLPVWRTLPGALLVCFALAVVAFDGIVPADGGTIRFGTVLAAVIGALLLEALPLRGSRRDHVL